jgi:TatD DNase family protein
MMAELFDTHVHLDRLPPAKRSEEISRAQALGVQSFLVPGITPARWDDLVALADRYSGVFLAPGIHPLAAECWSAMAGDRLKHLLAHPAVLAIGEIGLDSKITVPQELQEDVFRAQIRLGVSAGYPLILHCRASLNRCLQIFQEEGGQRVGGILHAFSGSHEMAERALGLNLLLGFGGGITWPEARRAPELLRILPSNAFVFETDAPDQSPEPHRRERNRPLWLKLILQRAAEIRNTPCHELALQSTANALRLLRRDQLQTASHKD